MSTMADLSTPAYKLEPVPGAGFGMVATRHIPRGTLIISEPPLFTLMSNFLQPESLAAAIESKLQTLSEDQKRIFFSLSNTYPQKYPGARGIIRTNSHPLGVDANECGIFPECSRFNHSCAANANYAYNLATAQEKIYSVKDIAPREEITVSYLDEQRLNQTRSNRRQLLRRDFNFECKCNLCEASPDVVTASNSRRAEIGRLDTMIGGGAISLIDPAKCLGFCKRIIELYKEEGVGDISLYRTYSDALQVCILHGDMARGSAFASLAVSIKQACQGENASNLEEVKPYINNPERYQYAGMSRRWATEKEFARAPGTDGFEEWLWSRAT